MAINRKNLTWLGLHPAGDLAGLTCYTNKKGKTVWFIKSPPKVPPSDPQRRQRIRFTIAATAWQHLTQEQRYDWHSACRTAGLYLHGYNLWIYWQLKRDIPTLRTIERQSGITLLPAGT